MYASHAPPHQGSHAPPHQGSHAPPHQGVHTPQHKGSHATGTTRTRARTHSEQRANSTVHTYAPPRPRHALIEGDEIYKDDDEVAKILGEFFKNAVKSLNVGIPNEYTSKKSTVSNDPIDTIISQIILVSN